MKRALIFGIIGAGLSAASSHGQGLVNFSNYFGPGSPTINFTPSTYPGGAPPGQAGFTVGGSIAAELGLYNGVASSSGQLTWLSPTITYFGIDNGPGPNSDPNGAKYTGWFLGPTVNLQSYGWSPYQSGQTVTMGVEAFNNGSYAAAIYRGFSGLIDITEVTAASSTEWSLMQPVSLNGTPGQSFIIGGVPEPAAPALVGLGLASLLWARRKKS